MKILLVNWVYNWGSTGFIIRDLKNAFNRLGNEVLVATGRAVAEDKTMVFSRQCEQTLFWRMHRLFGISTFRGSTLATKRLIKYIRQNQPDIVNLHLLHCNFLNLYYLLKWLGENNIKTVITNHAELYYTGSCGYAYDCMNFISNECKHCNNKRYATGSAIIGGNTHRQWKKMRDAFTFFKKENLMFTAVSPWTRDRFYLSPITKGFKCKITLNGLDTSIFTPQSDISSICDRIGNKKSYIIWVTANFNPMNPEDVKGGYYLLELARRMPNQFFVVVATSSANIVNLTPNIYLWGKAKSQKELAQLYSGADVTLLVSRRETYSMVTAESLCCGTPVVGFKAGGPESIALEKYSHFVDHGDTNALAIAIEEMKSNHFNRKIISEEARIKYSTNSMALQYLKVYKDLIESN